jgi:hypothetical protein
MKNYRIVIKCQGGFFTVVDKKSHSPYDCLKSFKPKAVHTIEEKSETGEHYFTVFALKGSSVIIASKDIYDSHMIQNYWPKSDMKRIGKPVTEYDHENKIYTQS